MTGTELSAALAEKLKALLPDCAVRPAFTGTLQRLPQRAAVTVGVMQEENADGVFETVLGVQLYARERNDHARLFDAVCAAVSSLPCALRSVKRSETTYSAALSCLVTLCTVQAATGAADNARAAVDNRRQGIYGGRGEDFARSEGQALLRHRRGKSVCGGGGQSGVHDCAARVFGRRGGASRRIHTANRRRAVHALRFKSGERK
ncbi:MAG: hypothetical protein V8P99_04230 [Oscillospiraceae bacterium]